MMAGDPPWVTVIVVDPVVWPVSALALVTEPCVRTTAAARTLSLVGPGTRACQLGLVGHVGSVAAWLGLAVTLRRANAVAATNVARFHEIWRMSGSPSGLVAADSFGPDLFGVAGLGEGE